MTLGKNGSICILSSNAAGVPISFSVRCHLDLAWSYPQKVITHIHRFIFFNAIVFGMHLYEKDCTRQYKWKEEWNGMQLHFRLSCFFFCLYVIFLSEVQYAVCDRCIYFFKTTTQCMTYAKTAQINSIDNNQNHLKYILLGRFLHKIIFSKTYWLSSFSSPLHSCLTSVCPLNPYSVPLASPSVTTLLSVY